MNLYILHVAPWSYGNNETYEVAASSAAEAFFELQKVQSHVGRLLGYQIINKESNNVERSEDATRSFRD